jgi:hypothetical protein
MSQSTVVALPLADPSPGTTWFDARSCVVLGEEGLRRVFVGGRLVGSFGTKEYAERNVMLIALTEEPTAHLGQVADAFAVSTETLRQLRALAARGGIEAVTRRRRGGSAGRGLTARDRAKLVASFENGATIESAWEQIRRRASRATVGRLKKEWDAHTLALAPAEPVVEIAPQMRLDDVLVAAGASAGEANDEPPASSEANAPPTEGDGATLPLRSEPVTSARWVQHVGTWLMLAMVRHLGLYDAAREACADEDTREQLRIALDAFVCALALGEGCVEGVRRLMTPSGHALLRSNRAPSATWVRRVFGAFADERSAARLHFAMARRYVREAHAETERDVVVFYVDNHLRPYTGKETIRKGWRMQDKRVRPGVTDVYVHDEAGNPVLRLADATNSSLTTWLSAVAKILRNMVGPEARVVLAFDRGGAFPEQLAALRDKGFELVTYERKPYPLLNHRA